MKNLLLFCLFACTVRCHGQNSNAMTNQYTNALIHETSPYLLQHAHNPVNWNPWNKNTLQQAKEQGKLILISVGYSACHWCHVMEQESFENVHVAQVMNTNYINIKVDREERPDVDQVYMNAVQIITGQGGWPLNIVALPDGRPVWGGTYFKKEQWTDALEQIATLYKEKPEKLYDYADTLEEGIKSLDLININKETPNFQTSFIQEAVTSWSKQFDINLGGMRRAPKFMMPNNYLFLLRYAHQNNDKTLLNFINITLKKMAYGGVFDHIGGGFSRYAVDEKWHVPHFEKMLYDNGQLVSLYADAYLLTKNELYKDIVTETLSYIEREMTANNGAFYSSLDADSLNSENKLEEGAFYVWQQKELKVLLKDDYPIFEDYYNINNYGYWEHDNYVLIRKLEDSDIIQKHNITETVLQEKKTLWKQVLLETQNKRFKPRLDDKTLTSWNAIMLKGYLDAYRVFKNTKYLNFAKKNANFLLNNQLKEDGSLYHNYKNGKSTINGFLEDYATIIDAFIALYEVTLEEKWLIISRDLTNHTLDHFFDEKSKMFFFTSNTDPDLISRSIEYRDNVIPASNSIMAKNLFKLSRYFENSHYLNTATTMLNNVKPEMHQYPSGYSNWLDLMLNFTNPYYEIVLVGSDANQKLIELNKNYIPNKLIAGSKTDTSLPLLKNRYSTNKTLIYVCEGKTCQLPVSKISAAINYLKK